MVAHVQEPPQHRIGEEAERAQREDGRDGEGGVLVVRLDRALRRDDRRDAADRGSHRQQAGQLIGFELHVRIVGSIVRVIVDVVLAVFAITEVLKGSERQPVQLID